MITVALSGGLGNQMFQYAAAKALSIRLGVGIKIDLSSFLANQERSWTRDFELSVFNIQTENICKTISWRIKYAWKVMPFVRQYPWGQRLLLLNRIFRDKNTHQYDFRFERLTNPFTLLGYFQTEKYFLYYRENILKEFAFKHSLNVQNEEMSKRILATNAVSVHIRRGDYIMNPHANQIFAECSANYYEQAIEFIKQRIDSPVFYFFSDDIEWVKQNFQGIESAVFVNFNQGKDSYNDMRLMSLCKHNIIANSSFSWWGAWLNQYSEKIVIAPKQWFKKVESNAMVIDLLPEGWTRL